MSDKPIRFKSPARIKASENAKSAARNTTVEKAVNSNNLAQVKEALKKDDSNICGLVTFAVSNGKSVEIINYLLECEKDDLIDETRLSALNAAVKTGNQQLVNNLLDDVEQRMIEVIDDGELLDDLFDDLDEAVYTASTCPNKDICKLVDTKLEELETVYYGDSEEEESEYDDDSDEDSGGGSDEEDSEEDEDDDSDEDSGGSDDDDDETDESDEDEDESDEDDEDDESESDSEKESEPKQVATKEKAGKK